MLLETALRLQSDARDSRCRHGREPLLRPRVVQLNREERAGVIMAQQTGARANRTLAPEREKVHREIRGNDVPGQQRAAGALGCEVGQRDHQAPLKRADAVVHVWHECDLHRARCGIEHAQPHGLDKLCGQLVALSENVELSTALPLRGSPPRAGTRVKVRRPTAMGAPVAALASMCASATRFVLPTRSERPVTVGVPSRSGRKRCSSSCAVSTQSGATAWTARLPPKMSSAIPSTPTRTEPPGPRISGTTGTRIAGCSPRESTSTRRSRSMWRRGG